MAHAIGLDLGGSNIKGLAVTPSGKVLAEVVLPTRDDGTARWMDQARRGLAQLQRKTGKSDHPPLGVATPGLPTRDQRAIACMPGRLPGLEGLVWQDFLDWPHPVPVLNDAQAALLGEVWLGAARQTQNAILLTLGTGVGGAALVDGRLLRGHLGRAGHLGHVSLDPNGLPDVTGTPGSLEDAIGDCSILRRTEGRFRTTQSLVTASRHGDRAAQAVWFTSIKALAAAIASLVNVLDPEVVVIGGGIARAGPVLFNPLRRYLKRFEWRPGGARVRIVAARLGDRAGAFGAAWYARQVSTTGSTKVWPMASRS